jgi:hypothetical protein
MDKDSTADIIRPAMKAYGRALRAISHALDMQDQRTIDHTFVTIELINLFEFLSEVESSLIRAKQHLRDMLAILSMRGFKQFASKTGRALFLAAIFLWVSTVIQIVHCLAA